MQIAEWLRLGQIWAAIWLAARRAPAFRARLAFLALLAARGFLAVAVTLLVLDPAEGALGGAALSPGAGPQLLAEPERAEMVVPAGTLVRRVLVLAPVDAAAGGTYSVRVAAWKPDGRLETAAVGSAVQWVGVFPESFRIRPGERQPLLLVVAVPERATAGEYRATLVVERQGPLAKAAPAGSQPVETVTVEVEPVEVEATAAPVQVASVEVAVAVPPIVRRGEIVETGASADEAWVVVRNTGNVHLRLAGRLRIDAFPVGDSPPVLDLPLREIVLLPRLQTRVRVRLTPPLAPERYRLQFEFETAGENLRLRARRYVDLRPQ